jgi:hypothetical protein
VFLDLLRFYTEFKGLLTPEEREKIIDGLLDNMIEIDKQLKELDKE